MTQGTTLHQAISDSNVGMAIHCTSDGSLLIVHQYQGDESEEFHFDGSIWKFEFSMEYGIMPNTRYQESFGDKDLQQKNITELGVSLEEGWIALPSSFL